MADQGAEGLLSPFLRTRRFKAVRPYLNGRVLDVGCGAGALAEFVDSTLYFGVEIDKESLDRARKNFPCHCFDGFLPPSSEKFDTVVSLAVIEHVPDPVAFLKSLARHLAESPSARIVITTPHPSVGWVHDAGAMLGLFSKHANEEHEELLDRQKLTSLGQTAGVCLASYRRFLLGGNQLAVFRARRFA